jgi:CDP-diacylglycerol--serine O-phosphatidyltransferase
MKKQYGEIYLLPSFFSLSNVFFGFLSLIFCFQGRYSWAAFWIIMSAIMDGLDGIVARSAGAQSEFGTQLDSLADAFSFGGAPSVLLYFWGLRGAGTAGVFFSFIFLSSGILRLARYNVLQSTEKNRKFYVGLSVPSASLFMASLVLFHPEPLRTRSLAFLLAMVIVVVSIFMVSTIKYRNFLNFPPRQRINLTSGLLMAVLIASLIFYTKIFLLAFFTFIVLSGPATYVFNLIRNKVQKKSRVGQPRSEDAVEENNGNT